MNNGWSTKGGSSYEHPPTHPATMIDVNTTNFPNKKLDVALEELFQSGNDGKNSIETAVISKGGTVSKAGSVATFAELEAGINSLQAGMRFATGTVTSVGTGASRFEKTDGTTTDSSIYKIEVTTLDFKPDEIIYFKSGSIDDLSQWSIDKINGSYTVSTMIENGTTKTVRVTNSATGTGITIAYVASNGFSLPVLTNTQQYTWMAYKRP